MQSAQKIHELRQKASITQSELAEKLFVSRDLVSKWESGARRPDYRTVTKIAAVFGVSPDEIIDRDEVLLSELSACIPSGFDTDIARFDCLLNDFLHNLPERDCDVFIRRYHFMENSFEIASFYGMKEANVRLILHRTRNKLKKYLTEVSK